MAAQPIARERRERLRALVRYPNVIIPAELWREMSPHQQLQALYGASLDMCRVALLEWPLDPIEAGLLQFQDRVRHDVMTFVTRAGLADRQRTNTEEVLQRIAAVLKGSE
jgi:hypothetical protein